MSDENKARLAHDVLDGLSAGRILSRENEQLLRSFLPELPKQKTLEEIAARVYDAWTRTNDNEWAGNIDNTEITLESWLGELYVQLKGLKDTPAAVPAKPAPPEFLETEADYQNAPVGTVVIREGGYPWTRIFDSWVAYSRNDYSHSEMAALRGKSRVLRWAVGNEQL